MIQGIRINLLVFLLSAVAYPRIPDRILGEEVRLGPRNTAIVLAENPDLSRPVKTPPLRASTDLAAQMHQGSLIRNRVDNSAANTKVPTSVSASIAPKIVSFGVIFRIALESMGIRATCEPSTLVTLAELACMDPVQYHSQPPQSESVLGPGIAVDPIPKASPLTMPIPMANCLNPSNAAKALTI